MAANNATSSHASSTEGVKLVGWVLESPDRGSLHLLTTCLLTVFLCTWAGLHPRVTRNSPRRIAHKLGLFFKAVFAPEFIAVEGLQEWSQARRTIEECRDLTNGELELDQSFYVSMLALRYRTERGDKVIWPNQFHWLLEQNLIAWKDHEHWGLSKENIRDKSNADTTVKLLALVQVSWFVVQSIMRAAHDLPLSQLETMTLSYVPLFVVTYFFWWAKPKDVLTPSIIDLPSMTEDQRTTFENMSVDTLFDDEHNEEQDSWWNVWKLTPRVFEKEARDKAKEQAARQSATEIASMHGQCKSASPDVEKAPIQLSVDCTTTGPIDYRNTVVNTSSKRSMSKSPSQASNEQTETICHALDNFRSDTTFRHRVTRRLTNCFRTTGTADHSRTSQKKSRIIPYHPNEIVLAYWDPQVYHSKIWPLTCIFGASFGALHLISWHTVFPTLLETWLWRAAALASIVSLLIFMQYEKVVLRWGGPLTLLAIISPVIYLLSRIVMIVGVFAAFRAMDSRIYDVYVVSTYWVHFV